MNEELKKLIAIQKLDSEIIAKKRVADQIPQQVEETARLLDDAKVRKAKFEERVAALDRKRRDGEIELEEQAERIKKIETRVAALKTNEEYQAHLKEVEKAKESTGVIEERILLAMEDRERMEPERLQVDQAIAEATERWEAAKKALEEEGKKLEQEMGRLRESRAGLAATIAPEAYRKYMDLMERHNGVAVAMAADEICHGCHLNMPPQHFNNLKKNEVLSFCHACGRILYVNIDD